MKSVVSFDLDMTLLDHKNGSQIPDSALKALQMLRKNHYIVLATGRDMDNYFSRQFKEIVQADAIIHNNGTKITVGNEVIYETCMPKELVRSLLEFAKEENLAVGVTWEDEDYYIHQEQVTKRDIKAWGKSGRQYQDPWKLLEKTVRTMAYIGDAQGAKKIEEAFPEIKCPLFGGLMGADVLERRNSKAKGLKILCEYLETEIGSSYAFGDSMNDYEILQAAGVGIAMGNAVSELKEVADYVTDDISKDGIYKACKHFHLI